MDEIEEFIKIDTKIENGMVIIIFTTLESTITPLRIIKFLKKLGYFIILNLTCGT